MSQGRPNLDQVRARNALKALKDRGDVGGKKGGDALSGFPALVVNNGLLATLAFSRKQGGGHAAICTAIAEHLQAPEIALLKGAATLDGLLNHLTAGSSEDLRLCTAEALAYLNYLRRFAKTEE